MNRDNKKTRIRARSVTKKINTILLTVILCASLIWNCACVAPATPPNAAPYDGKPDARDTALEATFQDNLKEPGVIDNQPNQSQPNQSQLNLTLLNAATQTATAAAAVAAVEPVDLKDLVILAINSSRAVVGGKFEDLAADMPGLSAYLRENKTYMPAIFIEKSYGLTSNHDESRGMYRLKKDGTTILTLNSGEYDYTMSNSGSIIVYIPLRKVAETLGKTVSYYDGVIVLSDGPSPFDPARDGAQLSELRASLTGAVPVGSAEKFEKLMQSADMYYYGAFDNYLAMTKNSRSYDGAFDVQTRGPQTAATTSPAIAIDAGLGSLAGGAADEADSAAPAREPRSAATTAAATTAAAAPPQPRATAPIAGAIAEEAETQAAYDDGAGYGEGYGSAYIDDYSKTNIQVEGVDESDVVKTDGKYIYQVNGQRILIIDAYPPSGMKLVGRLDFAQENDTSFTPYEMYVDGDTLVVIGASYRYFDAPQPVARAESAPTRGGVIRDVVEMEAANPYYYGGIQTTRALVFDIKDRSNPKQIRDTEIEGSYKTSRKIGGALYLVANKQQYYYGYGPYPYGIMYEYDVIEAGADENDDESAMRQTAAYSDSATTGGAFVDIAYPRIYYFPGCVARNHLIVAGIDTRDVTQPISVESILDYGNNIYVSEGALYVATQNYNYIYSDSAGSGTTTSIHRFLLDGGEVKYDGKGEVPGTILNQFSMDESDGYLRVATTSDNYNVREGYYSQNNLYILGKDLKVAGRLEGIAPGEIIYSVRFIGKRGYVVTFKTVDPLFVIDLADPTAPKILGSLKIPGYSDYLHPYDENHIIGFGKDTVEYNYGYGATAYYQGMKIALFDVSDVANPIEMFKTNIGDRGTDSELLRNHRALLFSKERELLAFPVTVMTVPDNQKTGNAGRDATEYGQFEYQGAYVYNINLKDGFTLAGRITHITKDEYMRYGSYYWGGDDNAIERLLYIRESLYALSKAFITSCDIANPERETGRLALK